MLIGNINPVNLRGLKQALLVLRSLEEGKNVQHIVENFGGDMQLIEIWTNFLIHNHWIEKIEGDAGRAKYLVTDKGRDWIHRIDGGGLA